MVETVEAFLSEHNHATLNDVLYDWPASKFQALFEAYAKRKVADELSQKRALEIAAMIANTNMDMKENNRAQAIQDLDESYGRAIAVLYGEEVDDQKGIDYEDDPFFAAMHDGLKERALPDQQTVEDIE